MSSQILINEVYPNPNSGNEWVELIFSPGVGQGSPPSLLNFSLSDNNQAIHTFDGQEIWENNFLVIEVTKLNNDQDSVILKDASQNIIDQFDYQSTNKGESWNRIEVDSNEFVLSDPSPGEKNLIPDSTPTPTPTQEPSLTVTLSPTSTPTTSNNPSPIPSITTKASTVESKKANLSELFPNYSNLKEIKLEITDQSYKERHTHLAIIGQNPQKSAIINAIMGSSLLILAAGLLFYDRQKKQKK